MSWPVRSVKLVFGIPSIITPYSASHYVTILYYACHKAYCDNTDAHHESFNTVHNHITLGNRLNFIKEYGLKKYVDNVNHGIRNSVGHMTFKTNNGISEMPMMK